LELILLTLAIFILVMHNNPELFSRITRAFRIRTAYLKPEVSIAELIIIGLLAWQLVKLA
tara:strand:- start:3459 stop:3638 length:180 start_codon:yes stop_codon:yes gene_type:complete